MRNRLELNISCQSRDPIAVQNLARTERDPVLFESTESLTTKSFRQIFSCLTERIDWISSLHQPKLLQSTIKLVCPHPTKSIWFNWMDFSKCVASNGDLQIFGYHFTEYKSKSSSKAPPGSGASNPSWDCGDKSTDYDSLICSSCIT